MALKRNIYTGNVEEVSDANSPAFMASYEDIPNPNPTVNVPGTNIPDPGRSAAAAVKLGSNIPSPINRSITDPTSEAEEYLNQFRKPESFEDIYERKRKSMQGLVDALNMKYLDERRSIEKRGQERGQEANAVNIASGLAGSGSGFAETSKVKTATDKELEASRNHQSLQLAELWQSVELQAEEEARYQKEDARRSAEDILARREKSQSKAIDSLKMMAASGLDFDQFKSNPQNKKVYDYALDAFGGSEEALKGFIILNKPQDQVLTEGTQGNKYYRTTRNPITGTVKTEHFELGFEVPPEYEHVQMGDELLFFPKGKSIAEAFEDGSAYSYKASMSEKDKALLEGYKLENALKRKELNKPVPAPTAPKRDTSVQEVNGKKYLIDNQTGETIREVGAGESSGSSPLGEVKAGDLTDLLIQYRAAVADSNKVTRYAGSKTKGQLESLRGQITAEYKKQEKLGTLDAGVQKLVEGIIGGQPGLWSTILPFSKSNEGAMLSGIDNFLKNKGGIDLSKKNDLKAELQPGEIMVVDRKTRAIGAIPEGEFDASKYIKI